MKYYLCFYIECFLLAPHICTINSKIKIYSNHNVNKMIHKNQVSDFLIDALYEIYGNHHDNIANDKSKVNRYGKL